MRWYFPDTLPNGEVIGLLYSWSGGGPGTELARVTFTDVQTGWCQALFSTPVAVNTATKYVVAVWTPDAFPVTSSLFAASGMSNGTDLTAVQDTAAAHNGMYAIGSSPTYPTLTFQSSAYYADVLFVSDGANPTSLHGWGIPIN